MVSEDRSNANFVIGRVFSPVALFSLTERTSPSGPGQRTASRVSITLGVLLGVSKNN